MIKIYCDDIVNAFNNCEQLTAIYTHGELVWPTGPIPPGNFYVQWTANTSLGTFSMEGVTYNYSDFYPSNYFSGFSGIITESAFYGGPLRFVETNALSLSKGVFKECRSLISASLSRCRYVGDSAFYSCRSLTSNVYLPKCSYIGKYAFYDTHLSSVYFQKCRYVDDFAFEGFAGTSIYYLKTVNLPICSHIGKWTFAYQKSLSSLGLPECIHIGSSAFIYCHSLKSIYLPECKSIDDYAFASIGIQTIFLPECEYIGNYAFCGTAGGGPSEIYLPKCKYLGDGAFVNNNSLYSINLPECSYVGKHAFGTCSGYYVSIPMCEYIDYMAFEGVMINNQIYSYVFELPICSFIDSYAFAGTSSRRCLFRTVNLPVCKIISAGAFRSCIRIKSISIPECEYIGAYAFNYCSSISSIYLPKCSSLGTSAFANCSNLSVITLGYSRVCSIPTDADLIFNGTMITGSTGSIYVPYSLVYSYQHDSRWGVLLDRIFPIPE